MDLLSTHQVSASVLDSIDFDLFITVSGIERRCTYFVENYDITARDRIALSDPSEPKELFRKKSKSLLKAKGFKFLSLSTKSNRELGDFIKDFLLNSGKVKIKILVDYSCMVRNWFSILINIFQELEYLRLHVNVYFVYSPVKFQKSLKPRQQKSFTGTVSKKNISSSKPTALIIGLGTDKSAAELVLKTLKPDLTILMYSDPALEKVYIENIFKNNEKIISRINTRNLISYPVKDAEKINQIITEKCIELRLTHNVVISPLGPKIFSLNAYLVASRYPDIEIIYPAEKKTDYKSKREPSGDVLVQKVVFVTEEDYK